MPGYNPCCPSPQECLGCAGDVPQEIQVDLTGIADDACSLCGLLNGTFVCAFDGEWPPSESSMCTWRYVGDVGGPCDVDEHECGFLATVDLHVTIEKTVDEHYKLSVLWSYSTTTCTCSSIHEFPCTPFGLIQDDPFDCAGFDDYPVPVAGDGDGQGACDYSEATCLLTAL